MRNFLESWGLYRKLKNQKSYSRYEVQRMPASLTIFCTKCEEKTTWKTSKSNVLGLSTEIFECADCSDQRTAYFLKANFLDAGNVYDLEKVGQFPGQSVDIPKEISKNLGGSEKLYKKGLECCAEGFGIGAVAYFRRVVEDKTNDLLNTMADLAHEYGEETAVVDRIRNIRDEKIAYEEKIKAASQIIPKSLRPGGTNALHVLFQLLSQRLHSESEESCLETAEGIRDVLEHVFGKLRAEVESHRSFQVSLRGLQEKLTKKPK